MTLGPVGITVHAPINMAAPSKPSFGINLFSFISSLRLRQNLLPAIWTFLDVGVVALTALTVIPILLCLHRLRSGLAFARCKQAAGPAARRSPAAGSSKVADTRRGPRRARPGPTDADIDSPAGHDRHAPRCWNQFRPTAQLTVIRESFDISWQHPNGPLTRFKDSE